MSGLGVWEIAERDADLTMELPGGVPLFFRQIPAGSFRMGSRGYDPDEEPRHEVVITHDFFLGTFPVTQEQYRAVAEVDEKIANSEPSNFNGRRRPVEKVSWDDASVFCQWLTSEKGLSMRFEAGLPTELSGSMRVAGERKQNTIVVTEKVPWPLSAGMQAIPVLRHMMLTKSWARMSNNTHLACLVCTATFGSGAKILGKRRCIGHDKMAYVIQWLLM